MNALPALDHERFLRRSFDVARRARAGGDHPFGAILVGPDGAILKEQGNGYSAEGGDMTAHAERLLATWASKTWASKTWGSQTDGAAFLARCTLYSSAEPCAMCSGAIYWAGIGRLVYGQSEHDLKAATGAHEENPTLDLPCRTVFAAGQRHVEVIGPLLEEESAELQRNFWNERGV
jgi:tRNA(Arg) A34 adenosine deaminase TadA